MPPKNCFSIAVAAGAGILLSSFAGAQTVWNLANDFSPASNPNGAWTYQLEVTPEDDDTAYTPIAVQRSANDIWGTTFETPPTMQTEDSGFWGIGRNDTGATQVSANVNWDPGEVLFHPKPDFGGSGGRFVITWEAPANMVINVAWSYAKRMTIGNSGVGLGVLHERGGANTPLRAFGNPEGASGTFDGLEVLAGDKLHFRFDNWGDAGGDITWADITVTELNPMGPAITSFSANPEVLADAGASVTFNWTVSGVPLDALVLTPGNINVLPMTNASGQGSYVLNPGPDGTTEYTLTSTKGAESRQRKVTVTLPPPRIESFQLTPPGAAAGQSAQFTWQVERPVTTLVLTPGNIDLLALTDAAGSGSFTLNPGPNQSTTYTLTATRGASTAAAQATRAIIDPAQTVWNLANDFSLSANPNGAWTYQLEVTPEDDDTAYTPIAVPQSANAIWGTTFETPPTMQAEASGFWGIGRNDTGVTQTSANVNWDPGEVLFHPKPDFGGSGGRFVITWQAPAAMTVDVAWEYAKRMTVGANGVGLGVLHESGGVNTSLREFGDPDGAAGTFETLAVLAGDKLHFRFDNWGNAGGDITWADITVTAVNPSGPTIPAFTASPEVLADAGAAVTFNWTVGGLPLDSLVLIPGNINVLPMTNASGQGSYVLNPGPDGTTEYTLTATKGADSRQRKVTVTLPAPQIFSFELAPPQSVAGEPVQFTWQVERPMTTLVLTPGNVNLLALTDANGNGSFTLTPGPTETTAYSLTASRGTATSSAHTTRRIIDPNAIFSDDFGGFTDGNFNGGQFQSGLVVAFGGNLPDWDKAGGGVVHVVDRANVFGVDNNAPDFAVMIWQDNVITQLAAIPGSNAAGTLYAVTFDAGPAVYQAANQTTGSTDGILIEILRADDSVLAFHTHLPGEWAGLPTLVGGRFEYTGDGSGDVRLRVGPSSPGSGRFGGTVDNISIAPAIAVPLQITSLSRDAATRAATLSFTSVNGVNYEVWASPDLRAWQQLDDEVEGTGSSTQFTDTFLAPTAPQLYYEVRRP